jgi:DNA-binding NtrC family response regulator
MGTGIPKVLLVGENPQGCSCLAQGLQERGCYCEFAASYPEICSLLRVQHFDLVLSPMRLRDASLFPLIDLLDGSGVTLFFSHAVEQGCWWLPALRRGERCFGSSALRPSEFVTALDDSIAEVRRDLQRAADIQESSVRQRGLTVTPPSRRAPPFADPLRAKVAALARRKAAG